MATTSYFPPLKDPSAYATHVTGVWEEVTDRHFLRGLAAGLTLTPPVNITLSSIQALPDVWGQIVSFQTAWLDPGHPLHEAAVNEWRGMVALVALSDWRNIPLFRKDLSLTELIEKPYADGRPAVTGRPNLARVINEFIPEHERGGIAGWTETSILECGENPEATQTLGLFSPSTLVTPSRSYSIGRYKPDIPWVMNGGYPLGNPVPHLTARREKQALAGYLENQKEAITRLHARNGRTHDLITSTIRHLDGFIEDLNVRQFGAVTPTYLDHRFGGLPVWDRIMPLCRVPQRDEDMGSDTILPFRTDFAQNNRQGAALYGAALPFPDRQNVAVWGDVMLGSVPAPESRDFVNLARKARDQGYALLNAEELLLPTLLQVEGAGKGASIETHRGQWKNYLLPVDPRLLAFLSPEEVWRNLTIQDVGGMVSVTLALTLNHFDGLTERVSIQRRYDTRTDVREVMIPEDLEIWPSFNAPDWRHYYIDSIVSAPGPGVTKPQAKVSALVSPQTAHESALFDGLDLLDALKHDRSADHGSRRLFEQPSQNRTRSLRLADRAPEALVLSTTAGDKGLIMLDWVPRGESHGAWRVAVDFGASGSIVLVEAPGGQKHEQPQAGNLLKPVIKQQQIIPGMAGTRYGGRLPMGSQIGPIASLLMDPLNHTRRAPIDETVVPYERAYPIPFASESAIWIGLAAGETSPLFGLKYSSSLGHVAGMNHTTQLFLKGLLLEAAAHVASHGGHVDEINWLVAHPDGMFQTETEAFENGFRDVAAYVIGSPFAPKTKPKRTDIRLRPYTENRASMAFFDQDPDNNIHQPSIAFDIGGFSTDVAIWAERQLLWTGSFALAGHEMLNEFLSTKPERADALIEGGGRMLSERLTKATAGQPASEVSTIRRGVVEMFLRQPEVVKQLVSLYPGAANAIRLARMNHIVRFVNAGFLTYLSLIFTHVLKDTPVNFANGLGLYYGGRAAGLCAGLLPEDTIRQDARIYLGPSVAADLVSVLPKQRHAKEEVVRGLFSAQVVAAAQNRADLPMGEIFSLKPSGGPAVNRQPHEVLDINQIGSIDRTLSSLPTYEDFLKTFTQQTQIQPPLAISQTPEFKRQLLNDFNQELRRAEYATRELQGNGGNVPAPIQPLFILALRRTVREWHRLP